MRIMTAFWLLLSLGPAVAESPYVLLNYDYETVNFRNWDEPRNRHWSYWNLERVIPFPVEIGRGELPIHEFGKSSSDLSEITVSHEGRDVGLAEYFNLARVNGFLVVKNNDIVFEAYPRQMRRSDRHCVMSSSKSFVTAVLGNLVDRGAIDPNATIGFYVPDVGAGYKGVSIRDALDMNAPIAWSEDYTNPASEGMRIFQAEAMHPGYDHWPGGARDFFRELRQREDHVSGATHYVTANASVLGWLLTEVTGVSWNRLAQIYVWEKIGAERNALNFEDHTGYGQASGSFVMTLRDFARYAQIYANRGMAQNGQRIFSEEWFEAIVSNSNATREQGYNWRYSHFVEINDQGALYHGGYGGQFWYANPATGLVVVQFATSDAPGSRNPAVGSVGLNLVAEIDRHLANNPKEP